MSEPYFVFIVYDMQSVELFISQKGPQALPDTWLLIDSCSTVDIIFVNPKPRLPNGYSTVMPAELQSVTLSHQVDPHKTLTTHKLACFCFAAIFGHQ